MESTANAANPQILRAALAGNPNCGKTALFNALTGARQKVGNYPGVTVEKKEGFITTPSGAQVNLLDLPGTYSLDARTPDEQVTRDVLLGRLDGEAAPQAVIAVADATSLERGLALVLELKRLGRPTALALNMMDLARSRGLDLDLAVLERELGIPVIATVAVRGEGIDTLLSQLSTMQAGAAATRAGEWVKPDFAQVRSRFAEVDRILRLATRRAAAPAVWTDRIDRVVLHPLWGSLLLLAILAAMFQAIFSWASVPADWIEKVVGEVGLRLGSLLAEGPLKSLLIDGVFAGVGSVLVFLPQILLLFLFILLLEDSGYMARAAVLMDRWMGGVGLHGRAFIPLLSSYACAIPGIMATRTIDQKRDRLTTILIAPLATCSARLPVYTLLIAAFVPNRPVFGGIGLQGLVMFALYAAGLLIALAVAFLFKKTLFRGRRAPLLLELPTYKRPSLRNVGLGLLERSKVFLRRAGTVILSLSVLIWFLTSYPKAPEGASEPAIHYSFAGRIGRVIEPSIAPIGFDWRIGVALIPGFAAREVMVSALATVYAVEGGDEDAQHSALESILGGSWSLATALSLLMWYVIAPQCISTLAVVRRETNSWKWPSFLFVYLTALAYVASLATYHAARALGWG